MQSLVNSNSCLMKLLQEEAELRKNANLNPSEEALPTQPIAEKKSPSKNMIKERSSGSLAVRRGSSKSKDKSAASVASQTSGSHAILDPNYHPFINDITEDDQTILCKGNDVLINLNLSYNKIHKEGAGAIADTLHQQQRLVPTNKGLLRVTTAGNNFHSYCSFKVNEIEEILVQKARRMRGSINSIRSGSGQKKSGSKVSLLPPIKT
nr:unnamed protein product [Callosobruchus analis]